jgi:glycosyltransferase involved in cell wall biosynthesis
MKNKKLALIFSKDFMPVHLVKDVFLVPYYIGSIYGINVDIIYSKSPKNKDLPHQIRGARLVPLFNIFLTRKYELLRTLVFFLYIFMYARFIDFLMIFHFSDVSAIIGFLYKKINKNGILYVKADSGGNWVIEGYQYALRNSNKKYKYFLKKYLYSYFLENINLITIETETGYAKLCENKILNIDLRNKTRFMINGFDLDQYQNFGIQKLLFEEKENIIITAGRIGTKQKNTEMLLSVCEKIMFGDWKIIFIGDIEKEECDFQKKIDTFFISNPHLRRKVVFTGPINQKHILWQWYNKAKVFVLSSAWEGFPNVFAEALWFKNYIISTDVGGAKEITNYGYGEIFKTESELVNILQNIIKNNILKDLYAKIDFNEIDISWRSLITAATKDLNL